MNRSEFIEALSSLNRDKKYEIVQENYVIDYRMCKKLYEGAYSVYIATGYIEYNEEEKEEIEKEINEISEKGYYINEENKTIVLSIYNKKYEEILSDMDADWREKLQNIEIQKFISEEQERLKYEMNERKDRITRCEIEIREERKVLKRLQKELEKQMLFIPNIKKVDEIRNEIENEFEIIKKNCKNMSVRNGIIEIETNEIICYEPITDRKYKIGNVLVEINWTDGDIHFIATEGTILRKGYWGEKQVHPHIDTCGRACLGNASEQLAVSFANRQFSAMYMIALNFLKTVNVEDIAGYAISFWDEVDESGNIITEGHRPDYEEYGFESQDYEYYAPKICEICGAEIDEDDVITCEDCGRTVCTSCATETGNGRWICNTCIEENYEKCDECGEYYIYENMREVEGHMLCPDCYENETTQCGHCEEIVMSENTHYVREIDEILCDACYEEWLHRDEGEENE